MRLTDQIRALCDQIDGGAPVPPVVPPVITVPSGVSASVPGFASTIIYELDWGGHFLRDTYPYGQTAVPRWAVIVGFTTPASGTILASVAPYPGTMSGCWRACSISENPGDFSKPDPWTRRGFDSGIQAVVSTSPVRGTAALKPYTRYFLNLASIDEYGQWTAPDAGDLRLEITTG